MQVDYSQIIIETINKIFAELFSSMDKSLYRLLDKTVFVSDSILADSFFTNIFAYACAWAHA